MKITLESTNQIVELNGVMARVWQGETDSGIPVQAFVTRIAVDREQDTTQFERELLKCAQPLVAWPTRLVL